MHVKHKTLQEEILVAQTDPGRFCGAGWNSFEGIVFKGAAGGAGGHDTFFRAGDLIFTEGFSQSAVCAAGFDGLLEQVHGAQLP